MSWASTAAGLMMGSKEWGAGKLPHSQAQEEPPTGVGADLCDVRLAGTFGGYRPGLVGMVNWVPVSLVPWDESCYEPNKDPLLATPPRDSGNSP